MGLFSGGRSTSASTSITTDSRIAQESGVALSSSSGNTVNIESMDADIAARALDASERLSAIGGEGFASLLGTAERLFDSGSRQAANALDVSANAQQSVRDAYESAATLRAGTIDQRTLIVIVVAVGVGLFALTRKG